MSTLRQTPRLGAVLVSEDQTQFSVWAPSANNVTVQIVQRIDVAGSSDVESVLSEHPLACCEAEGHADVFTGIVDGCPADTLYRFKLDNRSARPDPRSRFQPMGVHGPSQVIDASKYAWQDSVWEGVQKRDLVIYELHVGSFSESGTYAGAIEKLDELTQLGITAIEVLPLAQCPGKWNWGYDGVNYFAPNHGFGRPDELKAFVDACHACGIAVINDVVYNHVGPEGNYLSEFGPYRSQKFGTPWGDAFDFDQPRVRQFVIDNIMFWMDEYHFDGLRLDAVHYMFDDSDGHILQEIQSKFRQYESTLDREVYLIGESNIYDPELVGDVESGNPHYDAIWSDCLMHSIYTLGNPGLRLTNRAYQPTDIAESLEHAYVFSTPEAVRVTDEIRLQHHAEGNRKYIESLIVALQTHDSVGNHPHGRRLHHLTSEEYQRAAAGLVLLYPSIPMLFMGEEWSTDAPFPFFADFEDQALRRSVDQGRRDEYPHHDWKGSPLPSDPEAFLSTKSSSQQLNVETNRWYKQLLAFRKRGVTQGWLAVENWSVSSDLANSIFKLVYQNGDQEIHVCSRLARADADPIELSELEVGEVVLDSRTGEAGFGETGLNQTLAGQHCLVWLS